MPATTARLHAKGLHCPSCSMLITMSVQDLPGVTDATCDHVTGETVVTYDDATLDTAGIVSAIEAAGYRVADARPTRS